MKKLVSIIVSIYNEEKNIDKSGHIIDSLMEKAIEWIYLETHFDEPILVKLNQKRRETKRNQTELKLKGKNRT
mgnify:CR=1 FL=1